MINANSIIDLLRLMGKRSRLAFLIPIGLIFGFLCLEAQPLKETQQHITALKRNIAMLEQLIRKSGGNYNAFLAYPQTEKLLEDTKNHALLMGAKRTGKE